MSEGSFVRRFIVTNPSRTPDPISDPQGWVLTLTDLGGEEFSYCIVYSLLLVLLAFIVVFEVAESSDK